MGPRWHELTDDEREREYSPSSCLPDGDYRPFVAQYVHRSEAAWQEVEASAARTTVLRYGDLDTNTIDVAVPSVEACPLLVFIHGGYWQELSKAESRFAAADCIARGWAFAAVDYTLAPAITVTGIVDECRAAVAALAAADLGFDSQRIVVAGSSAGAHLAAMAALAPDSVVAAAVLVSGVFDLEPLVGTSINDALGLDAAEARRASPLHADLGAFPPAVVAFGDNETSEFKAQSAVFASAIGADAIEIAHRNHFDVILDLATPGTALGDAVSALVTRAPSGGDGGEDGGSAQ